MTDTTERMSAEDRAARVFDGEAMPDSLTWGRRIESVVASAIEECRRHELIPLGGSRPAWCEVCQYTAPPEGCGPYRRLSAPLLAAGVPERELRP